MSQELEEQIARRLGSIKWPGLANPLNENVAPMEIDASQGNMATWGDLARECIRLMEAAWLEGRLAGADETMSCGYSLDRALQLGEWANPRMSRGYPLTLPPNDWQP